mmetsp:Transcript_38907/g.69073  ORF Transcript_38907/g.69073 Transcript_38907/m.69073 type:complete len:170 (+) Transcript_38907:124-633(+)
MGFTSGEYIWMVCHCFSIFPHVMMLFMPKAAREKQKQLLPRYGMPVLSKITYFMIAVLDFCAVLLCLLGFPELGALVGLFEAGGARMTLHLCYYRQPLNARIMSTFPSLWVMNFMSLWILFTHPGSTWIHAQHSFTALPLGGLFLAAWLRYVEELKPGGIGVKEETRTL